MSEITFFRLLNNSTISCRRLLEALKEASLIMKHMIIENLQTELFASLSDYRPAH